MLTSPMRVHHLNAATMCPLGGRLLFADSPRFVCHCLLVETPASGLVLVDTGLGLDDLAQPQRLGTALRLFIRPRFDPEETLARQVERLGFQRSDVRHIVLTHLDVDHAGGLPDFPQAQVHVYSVEHEAAMKRSTLIERERYRSRQWAHDVKWRRYGLSGEPWHGFDCVRQLDGLPPEILLVPLVGHTRGHCAVAVGTKNRWLVHAGDAYFFHGEMDPKRPRCPAALRAFQRTIQMLPDRVDNQRRLRGLVRDHSSGVDVFCAHDEAELRLLAARASDAAEHPMSETA